MTEVLKVGDKVPNLIFDVYDPAEEDFKVVNLEDVLKEGKWVILFFYPGDFTFVCPTELKDLADKYGDLKKLGAEVFSMSTDSKYVHMAWQKTEPFLKNVKFKMGSDGNGTISKLFGIYNEEKGMSRRGTFIINPDGVLVGIEITYDNVGRNADELLRKVKAYVYLAKHPDEACPAKWDEGSKTLKISKELVGRVGYFLNS
jgi:peroxiredoxin (alkyl hydroperoxide reductase subunit C)